MEVLVNETCIKSMARQLVFLEFLSGRSWFIDTTEMIVKFGDDLTYPIQLLGTASDISQTWLWAWANDASGFPPAILEKVNSIKNHGTQHDIEDFTEPQIPLQETNDAHRIAMVCSELVGGVPYYRGPYPNGAVFFLVLDTPSMNERVSTVSLPRIITTTFTGTNVSNHRTAVSVFLRSQGYELNDTEGEAVDVVGDFVVKATRADDYVEATFDERNGLVEINITLASTSDEQDNISSITAGNDNDIGE